MERISFTNAPHVDELYPMHESLPVSMIIVALSGSPSRGLISTQAAANTARTNNNGNSLPIVSLVESVLYILIC
ncbi:Uncharacterised protein [uncultured archaeon]|nr:Uncharacterised protein [uncultured archaeon]